MKTLMSITILIAVIILLIIVMLARHGLFTRVEVTEQKCGPYVMVYTKHIGDYKNIGQVTDKIYYDLKNNYGIETTKGFGIFYDNPQKVDKNKLRSIAGCIIENRTAEELAAVKDIYQVFEFPHTQSVIAEFPYTGKTSIMLGVIKVYPKLHSYLQKNSYALKPVMEIYDQPGKTITYISSVAAPDELFESLLEQK